MLDLAYQETLRGFAVISLTDRNGQTFQIQESSVADESCIWLGLAKGDRAHLTVEHVEALLPVLQYFVEHGELPRDRCSLQNSPAIASRD